MKQDLSEHLSDLDTPKCTGELASYGLIKIKIERIKMLLIPIGTILISSEVGETDDNLTLKLDKFGIQNGSRLKVDDFLHNSKLIINIEYQ